MSETRREYEAEQWAISTMRREGVPVPRSMIIDAKKYVSDCLKEEEGYVESHVMKFIKTIPKSPNRKK
jgi:uncharacterized linocin/CFP29 family protein